MSLSGSLEEKEPLEQLVVSAQNGDQDIQNLLLKKYKPFIAKNVSEVCKRYIDPEVDDEFSIGLVAFNEAIFSYSASKGSTFLPFAKIVIKRRVIDYIRSNQNKVPILSLEADFNQHSDEKENLYEFHAVKELYDRERDTFYRKEEILMFRDKLKAYNLTLKELTEVSPKHKDARESAVRSARILYDDFELREYVQLKKKLPLKKLVKKVNVSKKTLERNRKFILAIFIILSEDFVYLKDYLKGIGQ